MGETGHLSCPLHFYNMLVHLIANGKTREENVAVKNIWQKDNLVFLDLYFYRIKRSQVIDSVYIKDFLDLSNEKFYASAELFIADYVITCPVREWRLAAEFPENRILTLNFLPQ